MEMAEYANRKSDQVESLVILWVQLPPRSNRSRGQTARRPPDRLEAMVQLHPGSIENDGLQVLRQHASLVTTKPGFNSRADLC